MTLWQGILLGLVQGLAEFLPVSSSGHLRVLEVLTGVRAPGVFVEVALHVATLAAGLGGYGRPLVERPAGAFRSHNAGRCLLCSIAIHNRPPGFIGILFQRKDMQARKTRLYR